MSDTDSGGPLPPPPSTAEAPPAVGPPERRHRLRAALIALGVLTAVFGVYRYLAQHQYDQALAAHRAGRCQTAVDRYQKVTGIYRCSGVQSDPARRGAAECRMFLTAERVPSDQYATATRDYRAFLGRYSHGLLTGRARERLASVYARWGDHQIRDGDYDGGIGKYATAIREFAVTKGAAAAQTAVQALIDDAAKRSRSVGTACSAVEILVALVDDDVNVAEAKRSLPTAYYQCARREVKGHEDSSAIDHLHNLLHDFPKTFLRAKAKSLLVDARVDGIRRGNPVKLGPPQRTGSTPSGQVELSFRNSSPHRFELLVSGPVSKSMVVGKCSTCQQYAEGHEPAFCPGTGPTLTLTLPPGTYKVVFHDPDTVATKDAYGVWTLSSGGQYGGCNLLTETT
jgi:hypothetical protein